MGTIQATTEGYHRTSFRPETSKPAPQTNAPDGFAPPDSITVNTIKNETTSSLHRRILMEAASEAGLDGTAQQRRFVNRFLPSGIAFADKESDPSPGDGRAVKKEEIGSQPITYRLSSAEKGYLKNLQKDLLANSGILRNGKTYENSVSGEEFSMSRMGRAPSKVLSDRQYEARRARELWDKAQLINSSFGTPSKLGELKNAWVAVGDSVDKTQTDKILLAYINKTYGGKNLWGDHKQEILELAGSNGVSIQNASVKNGIARFDISVENLLRLHHSYIGVQERVNEFESIADGAQDRMALNQFLKGFGEGAWNTLKANWNAVTHPVETVQRVRAAVSALANLSKEDLNKVYQNLKAEGYKFVFEKDLSEVSRDIGRVVGTAAVELALGKGAGLLLKALRGTGAAATIVSKTMEISETLGKTPIPTAAVRVITDSNGNKLAFPSVELKKLADIIKPMESRAKKPVSVARKAVNLPNWNKLTFKLENDGKTIHLIHNHTVDGKGYRASVRAGGKKDVFPAWMSDNQVLKAVREAYESSKKVGKQVNPDNGDEILELVGYSESGMKIRIYLNLTKKQLDTAFPQ